MMTTKIRDLFDLKRKIYCIHRPLSKSSNTQKNNIIQSLQWNFLKVQWDFFEVQWKGGCFDIENKKESTYNFCCK